MKYTENRRYRDQVTMLPDTTPNVIQKDVKIDTPEKLSHWSILKSKVVNIKNLFKR